MLIDVVKEAISSSREELGQRINMGFDIFSKEVFTIRCIQDSVLVRGVEELKKWTGKSNATIVYDSRVVPFTHGEFFDAVKYKRNIAVVGFTKNGDVFGGFYSGAVINQDGLSLDPNIFIFSFESRGRCKTPQKFSVEESLRTLAFVAFYEDDQFGFIQFSVNNVGGFWLGNMSSLSFCYNLSQAFDGLMDTTLTGKDCDNHRCTRLMAIQLS